jgi:hypothetical protein
MRLIHLPLRERPVLFGNIQIGQICVGGSSIFRLPPCRVVGID